MRIEPVTPDTTDIAVELLARFFGEEGFATTAAEIARNLSDMLADGSCWSALAVDAGAAVGVVTVTTMRYVEWGLLGEIGDLYVLPAWRGGLAAPNSQRNRVSQSRGKTNSRAVPTDDGRFSGAQSWDTTGTK